MQPEDINILRNVVILLTFSTRGTKHQSHCPIFVIRVIAKESRGKCLKMTIFTTSSLSGTLKFHESLAPTNLIRDTASPASQFLEDPRLTSTVNFGGEGGGREEPRQREFESVFRVVVARTPRNYSFACDRSSANDSAACGRIDGCDITIR